MQNMKMTASDVQEVPLWISINCESCKVHAQGEINTYVKAIK